MTSPLLLQKSVLIVFLGIAAQWVAWRLKIPSIVLLSLAGVLAGPVFGILDPARDLGEFTTVLIKLAVAIILFEGGLNLRVFELKKAGKAVRRLILIGVPLAWIFGSLTAHYVAGISMPVAVVLGAMLTVTGPTVIMPLIRQNKLSPRPASLLKWEGIINDPLGVMLAVIVFDYQISHFEGTARADIFIGLGLALLSAVALGLGGGYLLKYTFNRGMVPEFLKVPVTMCLILIAYGSANLIQEEAGLLAVTVLGFVVGNIGLRIIHELRHFKENITIFLVSAVFIILTAGLRFEDLEGLSWRLAGYIACVIFIVRPAAVWIATIGAGLSLGERLIVGWIAPRGVVAATTAGLFAPKLVEHGFVDGALLVPIIFAVIFTTVLLHGFSLGIISRKLGLASAAEGGVVMVGASPWSVELARVLRENQVPVVLVDNFWHRLRDARLKGIPVYFGEILSEETEENLDFSEMGYLLATSENDAYNALVCNAFSKQFGRERVFQLSMHERSEAENKALSRSNRGRIAFSKDIRYEILLDRYFRGWRFKVTVAREGYDFKKYFNESDQLAQPLLVIHRRRDKVTLDPLREDLSVDEGDLVVSYEAPERQQS